MGAPAGMDSASWASAGIFPFSAVLASVGAPTASVVSGCGLASCLAVGVCGTYNCCTVVEGT